MNRPCLNGTDTGSECTCNNVVLRYDIDFGCICIAENTWYDPTLGSCRQNCRNGTANPFNPVLCICVSDIVLIFNPVFGCVCPLLNQFYDPKSRMCVNIPKCLNGTVTPTGCGCPYLFLAFDPIKGCTCVNNALYFAPKLGACIRNCLNGTMSHLNNEECECPAEYPLTFLEDVGCVCQDLSLYFDSGTKMCKPKPCLNGTLNKISKQCQCS